VVSTTVLAPWLDRVISSQSNPLSLKLLITLSCKKKTQVQSNLISILEALLPTTPQLKKLSRSLEQFKIRMYLI
jgi:hypothetical protein